MPKPHIPSPSRSQGAPETPRRALSRSTRSLGSPARSTRSGRLSNIVDQFKGDHKVSFAVSPLSKTILSNNTEIEIPRRTSWWRKVDNSRDVIEVLGDEKPANRTNVLEQIDVEVLSQENKEKRNFTLDLPESSDESINSIIVPERRLFTHKENVPQITFGDVLGDREKPPKHNQTDFNDKSLQAETKNLFRQPSRRPKPVFPSSALNITGDKTLGNKTKEAVTEVKPQQKLLFGNRGAKRKNMFADFIVSESEDEIPEIQPKFFAFNKQSVPSRRSSTASKASKGNREPSPTSSITIDIEMDDWKLLPSSTMVEHQLEVHLNTPSKRTRLSKLSEAKESINTNSTKQSNKSESSKNKSTSPVKTQTEKSELKSKEKSLRDANQSVSKKNNSLNKSKETSRKLKKTEKFSDFITPMDEVIDTSAKDKTRVINKTVTLSKNQSKATVDIMEQETEPQNSPEDGKANEIHNAKNKSDVISQNVSKNLEDNLDEQQENELQNDAEDELNLTYEDDENEPQQTGENISKPHIDNRTKTIIKDSTQTKVDDNLEKELSKIVGQEDDHVLAIDTPSPMGNKSIHLMPHKTVEETPNSDEQISSEDILVKEATKSFTEQKELKSINNQNTNEKVPKNTDISDKKVENSIVEDNAQEISINEDAEAEDQIEASEQDQAEASQEIEANDQEVTDAELELENDEENEEEEQEIDAIEEQANSENEEENDQEVSHNNSQEVEAEEKQENDEEDQEEEVAEASGDEIENDDDHDANEISQEVEEQEEDDEKENDEIEVSQDDLQNQSDQIDDDEEQEQNESAEMEEQEESAEMEAQNESVDMEEQNESADIEEQIDNSDMEAQNDSANMEEQNESADIEDQNESVDMEEQNDSANMEEQNESGDMEQEQEEAEDAEEAEAQQSDEEVQASDHETGNVTHDTTGRNRKKRVTDSPEAILHNVATENDSFSAKGRNTSIRKTMLKNLTLMPSLAPRDSTGFSDGTKNSSAEGSGWDSHRTTRKTLRQTFGRDFTPRKSLRALVMEKSAKRQTAINEANADLKLHQANSTEIPEDEMNYEDNVEPVESDHEASFRTRQANLEIYGEKIKQDILERKLKAQEQVRLMLQKSKPMSMGLINIPVRSYPTIRRAANKATQPKAKKQKRTLLNMENLPPEVLEDFKYKPPKRFRPHNASWITKRLYKFLETKLEPRYDYKARVRAEKLVEKIYNFVQDNRRQKIAPSHSINELKREMARLDIVTTHFEFYNFIGEYMPREVKHKVVPDIINDIRLPAEGVFAAILPAV